MEAVEAQFVGSGDAFGSGGRFQTCIALRARGDLFLVDCGASSLIAMQRLAIDPNDISKILITHLHGDHFGGLPNFLLDAIYVQGRTKKLTIIGPKDLEKKVWNLQEAMYEGTFSMDFGFPIDFIEYGNSEAIILNHNWIIEAIRVIHSEPSNPHAIRLINGDKSIVYTGDTE